MFKIRSFFAYIAAFGCIAVVLVTFIGNRAISEMLVSVTGVKVSPTFIGGDIVRVIDRKGYSVNIHAPVFQGLFSDRKNGFVQIDYTGNSIPDSLNDDIDYDNDGTTDFIVSWEKSVLSVKVIPRNKKVISLSKVTKIKKGYCIRINLVKTDKL